MSDLQRWLLRRILRYALRATPYTVDLFRTIREEGLRCYPEDNVYGIDTYLREIMDLTAPPSIKQGPQP